MYNSKLPRPLLAACLSHLMTYITELLHKLSVESIVVSFFNNQRKQFKNQLTNSINNNINLFLRKEEDNG